VQVNAQNNDGFSALMWASQNGHCDVAAALVSSKAEVAPARALRPFQPPSSLFH